MALPDPQEAAREARRLFEEMLNAGYKPNLHAYTALMTVLQRGGEWQQCVR